MIGGAHSLKQCLPMKHTNYGFKAFLICESRTGKCLKHKFYTGPGKSEIKTSNLCLEFASALKNENLYIYG